ncbi:superoxide dismutase family protein [Paenibacillus sp. CMAA1364]
MKKSAIFVGLCLVSMMILVGVFVIPDAFAKSKEMEIKTKIINTKGEEIGTIVISQQDKAVKLHIEARNLSPGAHGIHFHENGKCDAPDFKSAGAHFNPEHKEHGFNNPQGYHAGDLPNLIVKEDGTVTADIESTTVTLAKGASNSLLKPGGTSIIIHEQADDYVTDPSGNSGDRIACAVIQP